jgi:iron complex outermembrane recepter protein
MRYILIPFLFLVFSPFANAQLLLKGEVKNASGQPLVGALIADQATFSAVTTDKNGKFQLGLKSGKHNIAISHLGYKTIVDSLTISENIQRSYSMKINPIMSEEFVVEALRANASTPMTFQNISSEELDANNLAQDLPILLNQAVSVVTTSDAGAGVGYTGLRIRGSDATRINVTVNGVPLNDPESHGVFWVNMPDFATSTENIQIQRGVGTSTNGAASFGASINMETSNIDTLPSAEFNNTFGSFNTRKHNAIINSGLINNHFNFEGRLSYIASDGYIDRSAADLRSYYLAGGYYDKRFMVKAITFSGQEVTQQAWWGTPESRINGAEEAMLEHAINNGLNETQTENLLNSGRTYNYYQYENEVDNYGQDHYQLISGFQLTDDLYLNLTGHYTKGQGYFEQFRNDAYLVDFGISNPVFGIDTITSSDLVVRRWLDNDFYGGVYSLQYNKKALNITLGGSVNQYDGRHFGEVIWSEFASDSEIRDRYYASESSKLDASNYLKAQFTIKKFTIYGDVQGRFIDYTSAGADNDQRIIDIDEQYFFINPKVGVSYQPNGKNLFYASFAQSSREPVRNDFIDAVPGVIPRPEVLNDFEMGWNYRKSKISLGVNAYLMSYKDQLVLTGELNDVGSSVRANVPESYRAGVELQANIDVVGGLYWRPNLTLSQNRIASFNEVIYDYTSGFDVIEVAHENTDIAFSPSIIGGSQIGYRTKFGLEAVWMTKYVGKQYLDNTSNDDRAIDDYVVNDLRLTYKVSTERVKNLELSLLVNNILNEMYSANGYTYSYIFGSTITENFYYPQAGTNWLLGLKVKF